MAVFAIKTTVCFEVKEISENCLVRFLFPFPILTEQESTKEVMVQIIINILKRILKIRVNEKERFVLKGSM